MKLRNHVTIIVALTVLLLGGSIYAQSADRIDYPPVTAPPESFFQMVRENDRDAARAFYRKYLDVKGMPVVASDEVADLALQRTYEIVTHMLAGRPDVVKAMVDRACT